MKNYILSKAFLRSMSIATSLVLIGCGGGGGSSNTPTATTDPEEITPPAEKVIGLASLSATLGDTSKEGVAVLKLDMDANGKYTDKEDILLSVESSASQFNFDRITTLEDKALTAQLIVTVDGYAPFQQILSISSADALVVDASPALAKPALKEVISLASLSPSARMNSVMEFGIRNSGNTVQSFSRLISLSQLRAEADLPIDDGRVSSYTFNTNSIPEDVETVEATMQTFDSTKPEDMKNFPGAFTGVGLSGNKNATDDEVGLESAAFDMLVLKDQNGEEIALEPTVSKLGIKVDLSTCSSKWTRYISSAQAAVIEGWGDYDDADEGYQVPIWSNDNSESAWKFIGIANYTADTSRSKFEMCIPDEWSSGYLNCDSPIAFEQPTLICINTLDEENSPLVGLSISGQTTSGQYGYGYTNNEGQASIAITDSNISKWSFNYRGAMTGWNTINITQIPREINTPSCVYELNVTNIINIYSSEIKVIAKNVDGSVAVSKYISLSNTNYNSGHYYYQSAYTDANGMAMFDVEPEVEYTALYGAGTAKVNVNRSLVSPETADSGAYADVTVQDKNVAPSAYMYLSHRNLDIAVTQSIRVSISGSDQNADTLSMTSLKLDGNDVSLTSASESAGVAYYYNRGMLDISSLSKGDYTITVVISDGTESTTATASFEVTGNRKPIISTPISALYGEEIAYIESTGSTIKPKAYRFVANVYDPDGDSFTTTMKLDGTEINASEQNLSIGSHSINITAVDSKNNVATQTINFEVDNLKPIIGKAGINPSTINLSVSTAMTIYAYVSDPDGDAIASVIATDTQSSKTYTLSNGGSGSYYSKAVNASDIGVGDQSFSIVATDNATTAKASDNKNVSVTIRNFNAKPTFYTALLNQNIALSTTGTASVVGEDPEGERLTFVWKLDGVVQATTTTGTITGEERLSLTGLSEGTHTLSCTITDPEGESATSSATIIIFDPTKTQPLTIKTAIPNLMVTIHDSSNKFKMLDSKVTDSAGDVTFNLLGTETSFSIAFDPSTVITQKDVYDTLLGNILPDARNNCYNSTVTECATADWCTLSTATSIPTWVFDIAKITDSKEQNITANSVDTNNDNTISSTELYTAILSHEDLNKDGTLSWAEINEGNVAVLAYLDVPIREYVFDLDSEDSEEGHYNYFCELDNIVFDINFTNSSALTNINVTGAGYGYAYNILTGVSVNSYGDYYKDTNGKYNFLIEMKGTNYVPHYIALLLDKTEADLQNDSYRYDVSTLTTATFMDVNITNDVNNTSLNINSRYNDKSLGMNYYDTNGQKKYYQNTLLTYVISAYSYQSTDMGSLSYGHNNYYGNGTLQSSYKASDYPMLDTDISVDTNATVHFSGADLNKIDYSVIDFHGQDKEGTEYENDRFSMVFYSFGTPTTTLSLKSLDIPNMFPTTIASQLSSEISQSTVIVNAVAWDFKDKTSIELIDELMSSYNYYFNVENLAQRSISVYTNSDTAQAFKVVGDVKPKVSTPTNPFTLNLNLKNLFK